MGSSFDAGLSLSPLSTQSKTLQTIVLCPTFLANLLGNICVCLAVARVRSLKLRPSSSILASLALSDLSMLSFLVFRLIWLYDLKAASQVCHYFVVLLRAVAYTSILHICFLSFDRYVAVVYPLRYTTIITNRRITRTLIVCWGTPMLSVLIIPMAYPHAGRVSFRSSLLGCSASNSSKPLLVHRVHVVFNATFLVAIPFVMVAFVYSRIAKISWSQSHRLEPGENLNPEMAELRRKRRKEMKWMKTIVMVLGLFALLYLPAIVTLVVSVKIGVSQVPVALRDTVVVLIGVHSAVNPLIYILRSNDFKSAFLKFFRRALMVPQVETINTLTARSPPSLTEPSVCRVQNDCGGPSLFLVPFPEAPLTANVTGALVTTRPTHPSLDCCEDDRRPSFLVVPTRDPSSPQRKQSDNFFDNGNIHS